MKALLAMLAGAVPGAVAGVVLWTAVAVGLLLAYWVGYEFVYLGLMCSGGRFGLNWFTPPSPETREVTLGWVIALTLFAFTIGEVAAGLLGAIFGAGLGVTARRLWLAVRGGRVK